MADPKLDTKAVAAQLGVAPMKVFRLVHKGALKAERLGRQLQFDQIDVDKLKKDLQAVLLTTGQAAKVLGVTPQTIKVWGWRGILPYQVVKGRFRFDRVDVLDLAKHKKEALETFVADRVKLYEAQCQEQDQVLQDNDYTNVDTSNS